MTFDRSEQSEVEAIKLLRDIVDANKLAWRMRKEGFKGDLYWLALESHIDAAEEYLSTPQASRNSK